MNIFPPYMRRRHEILKKVYALLVNKTESISDIFDFNNTVHADLDLSWIKPQFQEKNFGSIKEYQIVIATIKPGQSSEPHMHEIGASSFIVLGPLVGSPEPKALFFRTGNFNLPSGEVTMTEEIKCYEEFEADIPSYRIHQFNNKGDELVQVLIVTHPIISVEGGREDIYFLPKKV